MVEVLDFLRFLKIKQTQDVPAVTEARTGLVSTSHHDSSSLRPLQDKKPYHYTDPFEPAVPVEISSDCF